MDAAEAIASGISKQGLYYVIGVLCVVVGFLFRKLIADKDATQAKLEALAREGSATVAENGKQTLLHTHMLTELRAEVAELRRAIQEKRRP